MEPSIISRNFKRKLLSRESFEKRFLTLIYPPPTDDIIKSKCRKPRKPRPQNVQLTTLNAKPLNGTNENIVNPTDGRRQISRTAQWPYSVHGVVAMKFNGAPSWGSGILIGPNIVLTAGHNLYNYEDKVYADLKTMQFLPAVNGQLLPFGVVEVEKYFVSPDYINERKEDYGIMLLKKPVGEMTGYFGLACLDPKELRSKIINITGYPGDKVASKPKTYEMWGMDGLVSYIDQDQGLICYMIDTAEGQSGSGVYYEEEGEYFVCGVHGQGGQAANRGALITRKGYQHMYEWIQDNRTKLLLCLRKPYQLEFLGYKIDEVCIKFFFEYDLDDIASFFLRECEIRIEELSILAKNTLWIILSRLYLPENNIGAAGAVAIGQNTSWTNLSQLDLSANNIGDEGAVAIAQNTSWTNLSQLYLSANNIGDEGAVAIGQNTSWTNLSQLNLFWNNIGGKGAVAIGQNTSWTNLSQLNLSWNNIGGKGAVAIAQNTSWTNLSQLDLSRNKISDERAETIAQSGIPISSLALNNISYEGTRIFPKHLLWIFQISEYDLFYGVPLSIPRSQLFSIWKTLESSRVFDRLKIEFSSKYRSFAMDIMTRKQFEDFVLSISHLMHSRLDLNFPLPNTEGDDDDLPEEPEFNYTKTPAFSGNQLCIEEEGNVSAQNDSNLNFNSNNFSAEETPPSLKNTFDHSS